MRIAPDSIKLIPLSWSTIAGIRLLGLILKNSGLNCSSLPMSTACTVYGRASSSSVMEALRPFGVVHVYRSITRRSCSVVERPPLSCGGFLSVQGVRRQLPGMIADVLRPAVDQPIEGRRVAGKQSARGLFKTGTISSHDGNETISRVLRRANPILAGVRPHGVLHQLAESNRCAARLAGKPIPVPRQQGDLAGDHAKLRASRAALCFGRRRIAGRISLRHLFVRAPQIEVHLLASHRVEDQDGLNVLNRNGLPGRLGDTRDFTGRAAHGACEGEDARIFDHANISGAYCTRINLRVNLP